MMLNPILEHIVWSEIKYIPFEDDAKFFQIKEGNLFYNTGTKEQPKYELLKKDFYAHLKNEPIYHIRRYRVWMGDL